jgi:Ser/Thr protein kinase RdoA (MazF antagonist)
VVGKRAGARCWLLLEKVPGVELWQVGELEVWQQVAHWLAGFHVRFAGMGPELLAASPHLLEHTADSFRAWGARARGALDASSDRRSDALASALERYGEIADALAAIPPTLVHGELYPSNVLVVRDERPLGVYPVDWEMAAVGPAPLDVAALVGGWSRHERELLALAYLDGLGRAECSGEEREQFLADLSRCRLQLAVQWLGWASDWVPPKEHAHDWLGEALALSEELGLA